MPDIPINQSLPETPFDVIVIGTGVVGCAMARRFTLEGANVLVLEKAGDILDGASKANSAIMHSGFDAPPGSQELECIKNGYSEFFDIRSELDLPMLDCGAMVLAWNEIEVNRLDDILAKAHQNGVTNVKLVSAKQALKREPEVANNLVAALEVPGESIVDPWTTPYAYLLQALQNGAQLARQCEVINGNFDGQQWRVETTRGKVRARHVITCAGLFGDRLDQILIGNSEFEIRPRKGQFVVFDKSANSLTKSILLPVPNEITKGVVACPTIFGNLLVGPTAEEQQSRDIADTDKAQLQALIDEGKRILPGLATHTVTATYAGLRPATEHKDYQIKWRQEKHYCSVGGIRSTGLSAALGIAQYVYRKYAEAGNQHSQPENLHHPQMPHIAFDRQRDWQQPNNGGMVCHCELVTRREIENTFNSEIAPASLSGLKRRTRVTMGRCQGFYCMAELSDITDRHFQQPLGLQTK